MTGGGAVHESPRAQRFPRLTVSAIFVPALCLLAALGLLEITLPLGTVQDLCCVILPTAQWAFFNAELAAARLLPWSFGTTHSACFLLLAATAKLCVAVGAGM